MEGTPFLAENNSDKEEKERRRKEEAEERRAAKKPEAIGFLAVEPAAEEEPELSPLEKAIAATRTPDPEAIEKKPDAEDEPLVVLPETEPPSDRVPEEDARRIVREMVKAEQQADADAAELQQAETAEVPETVEAGEPGPEAEAEPAAGTEPEAVTEAEPAQPETIEPDTIESPREEPSAAEEPVERVEQAEPAPEPEPEAEPPEEPVKPKVEAARPQPVEEAPPEEPESPDEEEEKPGRIRSFFSRGRDKAEDKPAHEAEAEEEEPAQEETPAAEVAAALAAEEAAEAAKAKKTEGPEFRFNEEIQEEDSDEEEPPAEEADEERETRRKPEAKPERIGQMLLNTEAAAERRARPVSEAAESSKAAEEKMRVESAPIEPVSGKRVDTLSRAELMKLGETIEINGNNLRHIYETHLIGERGLRRLVIEYLRGGDLNKALRREVVEHEMDFERDPVMRDLASPSGTPLDGNNHAALEKLLKKADVSLEDNGEKNAFFKAQARREAAGSQQHFQFRRFLDIGLTLTITILIVLIIIIFLVRR